MGAKQLGQGDRHRRLPHPGGPEQGDHVHDRLVIAAGGARVRCERVARGGGDRCPGDRLRRERGQVELAEKRAIPSASFVVADLTEPLDFLAGDTFDIAVAGLVLHYLRDWVAPLRELHRVLRPDGTLVFSTHHPASDVHLAASGNYFATELIHDR